MILALALLVLAICASAAFAGAETGYYALNPLRLRMEARESWRAQRLQELVRAPAAYLTTLLVANNLANDAAVRAAIAVLESLAVTDPEAIATLALTPLVFVFGEAWPKQLVLRRPLRRSIQLAPVLSVVRIVLWPFVSVLVVVLRWCGLAQELVIGRHQLGALLREGRRTTSSQARVLHATLRALESRGEGLVPYIRSDLPQVGADASVADARNAIAQSPDALAVLVPPPGSPSRPNRLLLGSRLAVAGRDRSLEELALEMPQLDPSTDLSVALRELRTMDATWALVGSPGAWLGVLDLEHVLAQLLSPDPATAAAVPQS